MPGIGGTGVVTVSQLLGAAAKIDGKAAHGRRPDRPEPEGGPGRVDHVDRHRREPGRIDVLLGFDLLVAVDAGEPRRARPRRRAS